MKKNSKAVKKTEKPEQAVGIDRETSSAVIAF